MVDLPKVCFSLAVGGVSEGAEEDQQVPNGRDPIAIQIRARIATNLREFAGAILFCGGWVVVARAGIGAPFQFVDVARAVAVKVEAVSEAIVAQ